MLERLYANKTAVIIVIILVIFLYYKFYGPTVKPAKKKKRPVVREQDEDEPSDQTQQDAEQLYNLVHEGLSEGTLAAPEFRDLAGNLADTSVYVELKQVYNQARANDQNPSQITVDQYVKVLRDIAH